MVLTEQSQAVLLDKNPEVGVQARAMHSAVKLVLPLHSSLSIPLSFLSFRP